jgi:glycosyltransferase involved in cell wall biosynthesis
VKPCISLFFPVYKDEATVARVAEKSVALLSEVAQAYEIIIIDDGSPDRAGQVAEEFALKNPCVRVIHHPRNLGYGQALRTGFAAARYEWIAFTDGDDEYEIDDFRKLLRLRDYYDLIITFRYVKRYSGLRVLVSYVYNALLRATFRSPYRDISCGLRLIRKEIIDLLELMSTSPFIGAEIAIKTMLKGYRVGEVGIQTFPRQMGRGSSVSVANILATVSDLMKVRRTVFSVDYDRPLNR